MSGVWDKFCDVCVCEMSGVWCDEMSCVWDELCKRWVVCEMSCVWDELCEMNCVWDELCEMSCVWDELCEMSCVRWVVCEMSCVWDELCVRWIVWDELCEMSCVWDELCEMSGVRWVVVRWDDRGAADGTPRQPDATQARKQKPHSDVGIDPKQQQTMFPRHSCAIKSSLGIPFLRKETKEKKGDKPRNPGPNQKEPENHDGTQSSSWDRKNKKSRETSPGTLDGTRRKEEITMEHNATTLGRQAPQPVLEPDGTRTWWWKTIPGTLPETKSTEEMMMEQNARIPGTNLMEQHCFLKELRTPFSSKGFWGTSPGTLAGTRKWWWNRMLKE